MPEVPGRQRCRDSCSGDASAVTERRQLEAEIMIVVIVRYWRLDHPAGCRRYTRPPSAVGVISLYSASAPTAIANIHKTEYPTNETRELFRY